MLTCNAIHSPPGHGPRSHGLLSTGSPTQDLPPGLGGGLSHRRVLILVPGPHDVLQALHSLQFPHPPLTTATKGPVIIYVGGWGGKKSWGGPGLSFLGKRGGPKENFTMIGGGSLCVL